LVAGIDRAAGLGRSVVNLSLGSELRSPLLDDVILGAYDRGVVVVAAAGNSREDGSPNEFPANTQHVVTVAATNDNDQPTVFSTGSLGVDLSAPGDEIQVAWHRGYVFESGTSFAAPMVSGAAAWLWTMRPDLDKTQLIEVLRRSARDLMGPGRDAD